jgi:hypothetical protein
MRMNAIRSEVVGEDSQGGPTGPGSATPGKRPGVARNRAREPCLGNWSGDPEEAMDDPT